MLSCKTSSQNTFSVLNNQLSPFDSVKIRHPCTCILFVVLSNEPFIFTVSLEILMIKELTRTLEHRWLQRGTKVLETSQPTLPYSSSHLSSLVLQSCSPIENSKNLDNV